MMVMIAIETTVLKAFISSVVDTKLQFSLNPKPYTAD